MNSKNITLTGLNCGACAKVLEMKIRKIEGVREARVIQEGSEGRGTISSEREVGLAEIQQALAGTQYRVLSYN